MDKHEIRIRNKDDTGWVNVLTSNNIEIENTQNYFESQYLEDVLTELYERFMIVATNGESDSLYKCQPVYITSSNDIYLTNASDVERYNIAGFVYDNTIQSGNKGSIKTNGMLVATVEQWNNVIDEQDGSNGLVEGENYYLSNKTTGKITKHPPETQGHYLVPIGQALTQTHFKINFDSIIGL